MEETKKNVSDLMVAHGKTQAYMKSMKETIDDMQDNLKDYTSRVVSTSVDIKGILTTVERLADSQKEFLKKVETYEKDTDKRFDIAEKRLNRVELQLKWTIALIIFLIAAGKKISIWLSGIF